VAVRADATLLACGGAGALFTSTTNPPGATGDALALAATAGARLADLEFVQFHPTALAVPESPRPLLTEALRGAGARLVDRAGRRFMEGIHPDAELAPRHVVTRAILEAGEAFLDATALGKDVLEEHFPTAVAACRARGFDLAAQPVPVAPAAHYLIGGVATDLAGRASLPGLFAAGECATTGVHGANRMAGNSLSEAVVFGRRAAQAMAPGLPGGGDPEWEPPPAVEVGPDPSDGEERVIEAVTLGAGPIRNAASSLRSLAILDELGGAHDPPPASPSVAAGRLLVRGALARAETRGVHVRSDHPLPDSTLDGVHLSVTSG
jgi:L-aspartate oxidase